MVLRNNPSWSFLLAPDLFCPDLRISPGQGKPGVFLCHRPVIGSHSPLLCGLLLDTREETTLILPDFTGGQVEQLLHFLYGKLPMVEKPGEIYSCLGVRRGLQGEEEVDDVVVGEVEGEVNHEIIEHQEVEEEVNDEIVEQVEIEQGDREFEELNAEKGVLEIEALPVEVKMEYSEQQMTILEKEGAKMKDPVPFWREGVWPCWTCRYCKISFAYEIDQVKHVRAEHSGKKIDCPKCGKRFSTQGNMKVHMRKGNCFKVRHMHPRPNLKENSSEKKVGGGGEEDLTVASLEPGTKNGLQLRPINELLEHQDGDSSTVDKI